MRAAYSRMLSLSFSSSALLRCVRGIRGFFRSVSRSFCQSGSGKKGAAACLKCLFFVAKFFPLLLNEKRDFFRISRCVILPRARRLLLGDGVHSLWLRKACILFFSTPLFAQFSVPLLAVGGVSEKSSSPSFAVSAFVFWIRLGNCVTFFIIEPFLLPPTTLAGYFFWVQSWFVQVISEGQSPEKVG